MNHENTNTNQTLITFDPIPIENVNINSSFVQKCSSKLFPLTVIVNICECILYLIRGNEIEFLFFSLFNRNGVIY